MTNSSQNADARRTYQEPVARLLDYGECHVVDGRPADLGWLDYVSDLELTPEHVPELIRLACDAALHTAESENPAVWAPTHAWRALGQLRAVEAVAPLLGLLKERADDDWVDIELPYVFGLIGPGAVPHVTDFLADRSIPTEPLITAIRCLVEIAERNLSFRNECIGILAHRLNCGAENDPAVNGFLISALIDLEAIETIDVIRHAFDQQVVDLSITGDVEDVEMEFGLRTRRSTPSPVYDPFFRKSAVRSCRGRFRRDNRQERRSFGWASKSWQKRSLSMWQWEKIQEVLSAMIIAVRWFGARMRRLPRPMTLDRRRAPS